MLGKLTQEQIISHLHLIYEEAPFIVTYKSPDLAILYANKTMREYVGHSKLQQIEGKSDYDFQWEKFADLYARHEKEAMNRNLYTALFPVCDLKNKEGLVTCNRMPIYNPENELLGVLTHTYFIQNAAALELGNLLLGLKDEDHHYSVDRNNNLLNLSNKEKARLFFLIRGKSCKAIAKILYISPRTVESYINNLKNKFNCTNKSDLIGRAIQLGYHHDLPSCLLGYIKPNDI